MKLDEKAALAAKQELYKKLHALLKHGMTPSEVAGYITACQMVAIELALTAGFELESLRENFNALAEIGEEDVESAQDYSKDN